jgi:hypothetical protein
LRPTGHQHKEEKGDNRQVGQPLHEIMLSLFE